jgi:ligand-binding SRPBCC domain-containing protein
LPTIHLETVIRAPLERCFDLARDVEAHTQSTAQTNERVVGGVRNGLLELDDEVKFEAVHFGLRQRLTARITRFERPGLFEDEMVRGTFQSLRHTHEFRPTPAGTLMVDTFRYVSPLGLLGRLADRLFLERYLRRFLSERALHLKLLAESTTASSKEEVRG